MRLIHQDPNNYINRTIKVRSRYWLVKAVHTDHIELVDHVRQEKGKLTFDMWKKSRVFPELQEIANQYPRLCNLLRQVCLLTRTEAESAIQGFIVDGPFSMGSEAVARIGGSAFALRRALPHRHRVRDAAKREQQAARA
jgi:hypothetical protein